MNVCAMERRQESRESGFARTKGVRFALRPWISPKPLCAFCFLFGTRGSHQNTTASLRRWCVWVFSLVYMSPDGRNLREDE